MKSEGGKAEKRYTQSGNYVAAPGTKLFCPSTWMSNQGRWNRGVPEVGKGQESPK